MEQIVTRLLAEVPEELYPRTNARGGKKELDPKAVQRFANLNSEDIKRHHYNSEENQKRVQNLGKTASPAKRGYTNI